MRAEIHILGTGNFFRDIHDMYALELVVKQKVVGGLSGDPGELLLGWKMVVYILVLPLNLTSSLQ